MVYARLMALYNDSKYADTEKENSSVINNEIVKDDKDSLGQQILMLRSVFSSYFDTQSSSTIVIDTDPLLQELERITKEFSGYIQYQQDPRLLQLWFLYAKLSWNSKDVILDLVNYGICTQHSILYIQLSQYYERQESNLEKAHSILIQGLSSNAEPRIHIIQFYEQFQKRYPQYSKTSERVGYLKSIIFTNDMQEQSFEEARSKSYRQKLSENQDHNNSQDVSAVTTMMQDHLVINHHSTEDILISKYPSIFQTCSQEDHHFLSKSKYSTLLECLEKWSSTTNRRKSCRPSLAPKLSSMAPPFQLGTVDPFTIRYVQKLPNLTTKDNAMATLVQEWKPLSDTSVDIEPQCFTLFSHQYHSTDHKHHQGLLSLFSIQDSRSFWIPYRHLMVTGGNSMVCYTLYPYKSPFTLATVYNTLTDKLDELIALCFTEQLLRILRNLHMNHIAHNDIKLEHVLFVQEERVGIEDDFYICLGYFDESISNDSYEASPSLEDIHQQWMAPLTKNTNPLYISMMKDLFDLVFLIYQLVYHGNEMEIYQEEIRTKDIWHVRLSDNSELWNSILVALLNPPDLSSDTCFLDSLITIVQDNLKQKNNTMPSLLTRMKRLSVQLYQTED